MRTREGRLGQVAVLLAMALVTAAVIWYFAGLALGGHTLESRYSVWVRVASAQQVVKGSEVRSAGVRVGTVAETRAAGRFAELRLELEEAATPVYADAEVKPRIKTLAGEGYVDFDQGQPRAAQVPDGGWLPDGSAVTTVELADLLSTMDPATRRLVRRNLEHSAAIFGRGRDVHGVVEASADFVRHAEPVTEVLAGQRAQLVQLIEGAAATFDALADRSASLRTLVRSGHRAVRAIDARNAGLAAGLREIPATLDAMRGTVGRLGRFSGRAVPVLDDLGRGLEALRPAVADLRPAARDLRRLTAALGPFGRRAPRLLEALERFAGQVRPALPGLDALLAQVNPMLRYAAPYSREVGGLVGNLGTVAKAYDATGRLARLGIVVDPQSLAFASPTQRKLLDELNEVGVVSYLQRKGVNAYPAPGSLDDHRAEDGGYPRITADPRRLGGP